MTDWNVELEIARLRLHRDIERRAQLAQGIDSRTVNRSVGQLYTRRIMQLQILQANAQFDQFDGATRASTRAVRDLGEAFARFGRAAALVDVARIGTNYK